MNSPFVVVLGSAVRRAVAAGGNKPGFDSISLKRRTAPAWRLPGARLEHRPLTTGHGLHACATPLWNPAPGADRISRYDQDRHD